MQESKQSPVLRAVTKVKELLTPRPAEQEVRPSALVRNAMAEAVTASYGEIDTHGFFPNNVGSAPEWLTDEVRVIEVTLGKGRIEALYGQSLDAASAGSPPAWMKHVKGQHRRGYPLNPAVAQQATRTSAFSFSLGMLEDTLRSEGGRSKATGPLNLNSASVAAVMAGRIRLGTLSSGGAAADLAELAAAVEMTPATTELFAAGLEAAHLVMESQERQDDCTRAQGHNWPIPSAQVVNGGIDFQGRGSVGD